MFSGQTLSSSESIACLIVVSILVAATSTSAGVGGLDIAQTPETIIVSTDKQVYSQGEIVEVNGRVDWTWPYCPPNATCDQLILVNLRVTEDKTGTTIHEKQLGQFPSPNPYLFTDTFQLPTSATPGTYTVSASTTAASASASFQIVQSSGNHGSYTEIVAAIGLVAVIVMITVLLAKRPRTRRN